MENWVADFCNWNNDPPVQRVDNSKRRRSLRILRRQSVDFRCLEPLTVENLEEEVPQIVDVDDETSAQAHHPDESPPPDYGTVWLDLDESEKPTKRRRHSVCISKARHPSGDNSDKENSLHIDVDKCCDGDDIDKLWDDLDCFAHIPSISKPVESEKCFKIKRKQSLSKKKRRRSTMIFPSFRKRETSYSPDLIPGESDIIDLTSVVNSDKKDFQDQVFSGKNLCPDRNALFFSPNDVCVVDTRTLKEHVCQVVELPRVTDFETQTLTQEHKSFHAHSKDTSGRTFSARLTVTDSPELCRSATPESSMAKMFCSIDLPESPEVDDAETSSPKSRFSVERYSPPKPVINLDSNSLSENTTMDSSYISAKPQFFKTTDAESPDIEIVTELPPQVPNKTDSLIDNARTVYVPYNREFVSNPFPFNTAANQQSDLKDLRPVSEVEISKYNVLDYRMSSIDESESSSASPIVTTAGQCPGEESEVIMQNDETEDMELGKEVFLISDSPIKLKHIRETEQFSDSKKTQLCESVCDMDISLEASPINPQICDTLHVSAHLYTTENSSTVYPSTSTVCEQVISPRIVCEETNLSVSAPLTLNPNQSMDQSINHSAPLVLDSIPLVSVECKLDSCSPLGYPAYPNKVDSLDISPAVLETDDSPSEVLSKRKKSRKRKLSDIVTGNRGHGDGSVCEQSQVDDIDNQLLTSRRSSTRLRRKSVELFQSRMKALETETSVESPTLDTDVSDPSIVKSTIKPGRGRKKKTENIEDIYLNKLYKKPTEKNFATIFEDGKGKQPFSLRKQRRSILFDMYTVQPAKLKKRAHKATKLGWGSAARKRNAIPDHVFDKKMEALKEELDEIT